METFTKTYTGVVEITFTKSIIHPDGDPTSLRLTVPGMKPNISEECALRNAHKPVGETVFNFSL